MRKSVIGIGAAIVLAGGAAVAVTAVAHATDESPATWETTVTQQVQPTVGLATANGSGCPSGVPGIAVSYDNGIRVTYNELESLQITGATAGSVAQENCQLNIRVGLPDNVTYAVSNISSTARANLAAGATASVEQAIYIQAVSDTSYVSKDLAGPMNGTANVAGSVGSTVFAPCGSQRNLNVNTRILLRANGTTAQSSVAVVGGMNIGLVFKNC